MTADERTYSIDEIERETGYSRRTISYYIRIGLLPKVGQRGAKTRYSQIFLERLLFLKELRRQQDTGKIPPISLEVIRDTVLPSLTPDVVGRVARGEEPLVAAVLGDGAVAGEGLDVGMAAIRDEATADFSFTAMELAGRSPVTGMRSMTSLVAGEADLARDDRGLSKLLSRLGDEVRAEREKRGSKGGEWTTVEVTEDVLLSVRSKKRGVAKLVEKVAGVLRGLTVGKGSETK